jgi:hypothetical protein
MSCGTNGDYPYKVDFSGVTAEAIRPLQRRATKEGRGPEFLIALRAVVDRLHRDPTTFGEPLYRLPKLWLQIRCAVVRPLSVDFGVSEDRRLAYIKAMKLLSAKQG